MRDTTTLVLACGATFGAVCLLDGGSPWFMGAMGVMTALDLVALTAHLHHTRRQS